MIPPQVGMRLQKKVAKKSPKKRKKEKTKKMMREKERRGSVTILYHTCASK
jgi:hypothetical protein